ncbi:MAG: arginine--tRNA ligase [Gammaproteobacteria bacterium]|nr:arginine--tRNA ligase [Gammaproteobacteria bacterium]
MKTHIQQLLAGALQTLQQQGTLPADLSFDLHVERTRDKNHGDFACAIALDLAKKARRKPREVAEQIVAALSISALITKVEIAGPGFINFFMAPQALLRVVNDILEAGEAYGRSTVGHGQRVQVEFVSANPTGPLHVGHGRGAAYGAAVADLLVAAGFHVHREYYVNDAGRQMDILATSVWLRYLEQCGEEFTFPANGYRGDYVQQISMRLRQMHNDLFRRQAQQIFAGIPADEPAGGDKEQHIDALIERCKQLLGAGHYRTVFDAGLNEILADIRDDLEQFGVAYEEWFSERSLTSSGAVERALQRLKASGHLYEQQGAWWFRSSAFGDEKDRVVIRDNGQHTYFASDIAYHMDKMERGYTRVIDIWGADHHGYIPRIKAALAALGYDPNRLDVLLVQFAILYRGGEKVQMSTRSGQFVTLRELRGEVGKDAARFFYVTRKCEQHMDFDLDLAKSESNDNPVYYIQYAHARICSVLQQLAERGISFGPDDIRNARLDRLVESHEIDLLHMLSRYPETIETAALSCQPHQLAHYLRELAAALHAYYNAHAFLREEPEVRSARLVLITATRQVLYNGLSLLGMHAPQRM